MKPAAAIALPVLAAALLFSTGALTYREAARRWELARNAAPYCQALTLEGRPCRRTTRQGPYCYAHRPLARVAPVYLAAE